MRGNPRSSALAIFARHPSNWVVVGLIAASGGYALLRGGLPAFGFGAWPLLGLALFALNEYSMHRNILHMPVPDPQRHPFLFRRYQRLHYGHHQNPADVPLLFAPVWFTVPMTLLNYGVVAAILCFVPGIAAPLVTAAAILFGSMCFFLYYEWVHMVAHIPHQPRLAFQRYMKKYHLWHHFRSEKYWFGVTNPSMDRLLGTYRIPAEVELSPTARRLGGVEAEADSMDSIRASGVF